MIAEYEHNRDLIRSSDTTDSAQSHAILPHDESELATLTELEAYLQTMSDSTVAIPDTDIPEIPSKDSEEQDNISEISDSLGFYLREIRKNPLLTHERELELGRRIQLGLQVDKEQQLLGRTQTEREKVFEVAEGKKAEGELSQANLRLVVSIAKRYFNKGLAPLDVIQEGNLGLMKAVQKYDPEKGFKFSTYATWWIKQSILRAFADQGRTIRLPVHMHDAVFKARKAIGKYVMEQGKEPTGDTLDEVLTNAGFTNESNRESVKDVIFNGLHRQPYSLDAVIGHDDDGNTLGSVVPDKSGFFEDETTAQTDMQQFFADLHKDRVLSDRERLVLAMRFGLGLTKPHTLMEIGEELSVSRERVRQIEQDALTKIRKWAIAKEQYKDNFSEDSLNGYRQRERSTSVVAPTSRPKNGSLVTDVIFDAPGTTVDIQYQKGRRIVEKVSEDTTAWDQLTPYEKSLLTLFFSGDENEQISDEVRERISIIFEIPPESVDTLVQEALTKAEVIVWES